MTPARGLTLLETVIAAALLAAVGATSASLLVDARQRMDRPAPAVTVHDLSMLADAVVKDPADVGLAGSIADVGDGTSLRWPDTFDVSAGAPPVRLRLVKSNNFATHDKEEERTARRAWLVLDCGGVTTARWVELPDEEDAP